MAVVALCYCPNDGGPMRAVRELAVVAGAGIVGDRYYGMQQTYPGQNLTLIEAEEVEAFNARFGVAIGLTDPRRNVITRNVRLNSLVGSEFSVGTVQVRGVQLCEPCKNLARHLSSTGLADAEIVRALVHRAGLRVDVLGSGHIRLGDQVVL